MMELFYMGGPGFMGVLTLLLIIATTWLIYHFIRAFIFNRANQEKTASKLEMGKSIGLFAMITGILGQLVGFSAMFSAIEQAAEIKPILVYGGIKATMIPTIYGILIYLFTLLLWFVASLLIEKKLN